MNKDCNILDCGLFKMNTADLLEVFKMYKDSAATAIMQRLLFLQTATPTIGHIGRQARKADAD